MHSPKKQIKFWGSSCLSESSLTCNSGWKSSFVWPNKMQSHFTSINNFTYGTIWQIQNPRLQLLLAPRLFSCKYSMMLKHIALYTQLTILSMTAEYFSTETDPSTFRGSKSGDHLQQSYILKNRFLQKRYFLGLEVNQI